MTQASRRTLLVLLIATCLLGGAAVCAKAKSAAQANRAGAVLLQTGEIKPAKHESVFKIINFILLVVGLAYLLRKPIRDFLLQRSHSIRKGLEEGRNALDASQARLREVEEKLRRLDEEVHSFRDQAMKEIESERERLRQDSARETEKIMASAHAQIETATRVAKLELKNYFAQEALRLAEESVRGRMDDSSRKVLITHFITKLKAQEFQN